MIVLAVALITAVIGWLTAQVISPVNWLLNEFIREGMIRDLMGLPWTQMIVSGAQGIAGGLLALRVTWEAFEIATLRAEGAPTDPGGLLKRTVAAAAAIYAGPRLTSQFILAGNDLALWIGSLGMRMQNLDIAAILKNLLNVGGPVFNLVAMVVLVVLLELITVQAAARSVEMLIAGVVSPFMALGYVSGGGTADVWLREVIVLAVSQAVQVLLVHLAITILVQPQNVGATVPNPWFFFAALWVAYRSPHVIRNYAYSTGGRGVAGAAAGMAQQMGWQMILRRVGW